MRHVEKSPGNIFESHTTSPRRPVTGMQDAANTLSPLEYYLNFSENILSQDTYPALRDYITYKAFLFYRQDIILTEM